MKYKFCEKEIEICNLKDFSKVRTIIATNIIMPPKYCRYACFSLKKYNPAPPHMRQFTSNIHSIIPEFPPDFKLNFIV